MRSFRVRWPWVLAWCSGGVMALGFANPWNASVQAGPVPPSGIETWDRDYQPSDSRPASMRYADPSIETGEGGGQWWGEGCGVADDTAAITRAVGDSVGQVGNAANYGHERDWENAPYEFGDGASRDVREVAAGVKPSDVSAPHSYAMDAEYGYGQSSDQFSYPEAYFYKYAGHHYYAAEAEGRYGYDAGRSDEPAADSVGQIGNAANYGHERDWENAPYEYGDGTSRDVREVAASAASDSSDKATYAYGMEVEYGYGRSSSNFLYPEAYFYKYGFGDAQRESAADATASHDSVGQLGNAANYGHERDWENAPYEYGDGTRRDVREVATSGNKGDATRRFSGPSLYDYGNEADEGVETKYGDSMEENDAANNEWVDPEGQMEPGEKKDSTEPSAGRDATRPEAVKPDGSQPDDAMIEWNRHGHSAEMEYGYGGEYSYAQEKYAYSPSANPFVAPSVESDYDLSSRYEGEPGELIDYGQEHDAYAGNYAYAAPNDCYGANRSVAARSPVDSASGLREQHESGLELFRRHPSELLIASDQALLRSLERFSEEPRGARRAVLNDHLHGLGFAAIDFAIRFEEVTGTDSLSLADDASGTAALLACFRLVEGGELGMDEAVDLLRRTLQRPTPEWVEGVRKITSNASGGRPDMTAVSGPVTRPVARALTVLGQVAWGHVQGPWGGVARSVAQGDWKAWLTGLQHGLAKAPSSSHHGSF